MAYAAVISLKHTIERLINPITYPQITKSAYEKLEFLKDVLQRLDDHDKIISINRRVIDALDAEIREAARKLEDVIEYYVLYCSLPPSDSHADKGVPHVDQKGMEQEIDSFLTTVEKLGEEYIIELENPLPVEEEEEDDDDVSPIHEFSGNKSTTVGLFYQFEKIINELIDQQPGRKTVSLFGMAGIGKTHLAREIYQHPLIVQYFDVTAWVRVGQKGKKKDILVDIIAQVEGKPRNLYMEKGMYTLAVLLKKNLRGWRYLIVLDHIWSTRVYDDMILWLPVRPVRRFLLTTRLEEVAEHNSSYPMCFLNSEESWKLLWQNVFADKYFPPHLEKVGKKIAENCEGLPLLILTVAEILCGLEKTEEYWKKVADKKTTTFPDAYDKISKVLFSSYEYLPQHLKAFFLYMGVFPQSCEIPVPRLINLLAVEDFLESNQLEDLEYFALEFLKELVSNSLAIICRQSYNYKIKSFKLHSAYWHLCVKEARRNKFFLVLNKLTDGSKDFIEGQLRLSVQNNILFGIKEVYDSMAATVKARYLLCTGPDHEYPVPICLNLMLLKVLDALPIRSYEFPTEVVKLLRLRYLALTHNGKLPCSISKLQQLQCLILHRHHNIKLVRDSTCYPKEIWDMQELRHLHIMGSNLPDPSHGAWLPNLSTLYVNVHSCTKDVFNSIPYLQKLGIKIELQPDAAETLSCFEHIGLLEELVSLKCVVVNPQLLSRVAPPSDHLLNLPRFLQKLSLNGIGYSWKYMSAIGSLMNLKVLKLRCSAFQGPEWEKKDGGFQSLEYLLLEDIDLVHWTIYNYQCFHHLQRLIFRHCYKLKEILLQIGDIPTLETIEVVDCSPSVVASAQKIHENRKSSVEVVINSSWNLR